MILKIIEDYETLSGTDGEEHTAGTITVTKTFDATILQDPKYQNELNLDFVIIDIDDFKNILELEDKLLLYDNKTWQIIAVCLHSEYDQNTFNIDIYLKD